MKINLTITKIFHYELEKAYRYTIYFENDKYTFSVKTMRWSIIQLENSSIVYKGYCPYCILSFIINALVLQNHLIVNFLSNKLDINIRKRKNDAKLTLSVAPNKYYYNTTSSSKNSFPCKISTQYN